MTTNETKQALKVCRISNGKILLNDISNVLIETISALQSGEKRELSKLPTKLTLVLKSIDVIEEVMTDVLRFDGHLRLSKDMIENNIAKKNCEQVIKMRLQKSSPTNKRKSESQICLEHTVKSSKQQQSKLVSPPPHTQIKLLLT